MNLAFKYYGKQPSYEMAKYALMVQSKYNLNDKQLAGVIQIYDFFQRIALFDTHIGRLRLSENKKEKRLPQKTTDFFSKFTLCSDAIKYFRPIPTEAYFLKFAENIMKNISVLSDYIGTGIIVKMPDVQIHHTAVEYRG